MSFTINDGSTQNLFNISNSIAQKRIPLRYTLDTSSIWIYCNYPEALTTGDFGDSTSSSNGHCLNQVTVPAGTHRIFFSYQYNSTASNAAKTPFYFGIQVFNPEKEDLTFQVLHSGYGTNLKSDYGSWEGVAGESFADFFKSTKQSSHTMSSNGHYWFVEKLLQSGSNLLSGSIEFSVDTYAIITVYIYKTLYKINGYATPIEKTGLGGQYSGFAKGSHYISNQITLKASELKNGQFFQTEAHNFPSGSLTINNVSETSDLLPITLANPSGTIISPSVSSTNLGNWGLVYSFPLRLYNDTTSPVTFNGYIKTDTSYTDDFCVINDGSSITKYTSLCGDTPGRYNAWKWLTQSVAAGQSIYGTYRYVLGTNSCAGNRHIFTIS